MSFRVPTTNLATTTWSTRGNSEALPGYKILIIDPVFENLGSYRQIWSGSLRGFLELHNTVSSLDSKVFIIKSYSFNVRAAIHTVVLHEVGAFSPAIIYIPQVSLSAFVNPTDSDDDSGTAIESGLNGISLITQGVGTLNSTQMSVAITGTIKNNNDTPETASDYPL